MKTDPELLRQYVEENSEAAFKALVERHLNLVYSAALRQVGGDVHLAKDAAQLVFVDVARKAASLTGHASLVGWLYTGTCYAAAKLVRAEQRRGAREHAALLMQESTADDQTEAEWERLRPLLDRAMLELNPTDREAVLLRFFTGRTFAEIGAALALSEDTARKRVGRALNKLQRRLARRGVTSTTAALGFALSQQAVVAAPAGLAAAVNTSALAWAVGAGGSSGLGSAFINFMTATKTSGLLAAVGILGVSLWLNAYLWQRHGRTGPSVSAVSVGTVPKARPIMAGLTSMDLAKDADLPALRDALLAAGASETRARQIIYGVLRRRYREVQTDKRLARIERGWWKDEQRALGVTRASQWLRDDPGLLKELIDDQIEGLFGLDPTQIEVVNARYSYLPEEMRMKLARLERELQIQWVPTGDPEVDAKTDAERARAMKENQAQKEKLLAGLTPEQRREYDMRYGPMGIRLASEFRSIPGGTEEEFRKMYRLAEEYVGNTPAASPTSVATSSPISGPMVVGAGNVTPTTQAAIEANQRSVDRVVAELGYERALDYLWAGAAEYRGVATVVQQNNLPLTTAARYAQLVAETGAKAVAIHQDASLTPDQRRLALLALQQTARSQVDVLLPAEAQQKLPTFATAWLTQMSDGRYKLISPGIPGRGSPGASIGITGNAPNLPPLWMAPPAVRPSGN